MYWAHLLCGISYHLSYDVTSFTYNSFITKIIIITYCEHTVVTRNETVCRIRLNQHSPDHYLVLYDPEIFERMHEECHVIHIRSNSYFAKQILDMDVNMFKFASKTNPFFVKMRSRLKRIKFMYPYPFHDIMNVFYQPTAEIEKITQQYITHNLKNKPYLAIHARGFYDDGFGRIFSFSFFSLCFF